MLYKERYTHGGAREEKSCLDFSINVNPLGTPQSVLQAVERELKNIEKYPDASCSLLQLRLAEKQGLPRETVLLGNGADELIYAYARALRELYGVKKVLIFAPAFEEYARALTSEGIEIVYEVLKPDACLTEKNLSRLSEVDAVFLCSPSNPTGRILSDELLQTIMDTTRDKGVRCFIDLCFLRLAGQSEQTILAHLLENPQVAVVSAFTKIYAIAGLRLGYLCSYDEELLTFISKHTQCWNVSSLAQAAGLACLSEDAYVEQAVALLKKERSYLLEKLTKYADYVCPSEANYILFYSDVPYVEKLREHGIIIRDCSSYVGLYKGFYRVAVRTREENDALLSAMEACYGEKKR